MPLTVQSSIDTTFLDTVHFDVSCKFPPGYEILDDIVIFDTGGLRPFVLNDGVLKTQVFTISAYITGRQDFRLWELYRATMHPSYIDMRYPIILRWGPAENPETKECYLYEYNPPEGVDYKSPELLGVKLTLKPI